jgi:hypothetical protein
MTSKNVLARRDPATPADLPPPPPVVIDEGTLAEHDGQCPYCDRYIKSGRSKIVALDVPLPPLPSARYRSRGAWLAADGRQANVRSRRWVHAHCMPHIGDAEAQEALALERREELDAKRREADSNEFSGPHRQGRRR